MAAALKSDLRGTPCRVFINDVRVRVEKTHAYYYPRLAGELRARRADHGSQGREGRHPVPMIDVAEEAQGVFGVIAATGCRTVTSSFPALSHSARHPGRQIAIEAVWRPLRAEVRCDSG
jgi:hypothetical protein